jgi:predicted CopG family antitoxin
MGRQHTTWISDETWRKLENIKGDSVSEKIRNAIEQVDPDREMAFNAKLRQLDRAREALRRLKFLIEEKEWGKVDALFEDIWWLVE